MIDREKVRELALLMFDSGHLTLPGHERVITEWLERNQPEPVVVGLSDEHLNNLIDFWSRHEGGWIDAYTTWSKTQAFSQVKPPLSNEQVYSELYQEYQDIKKELEQLKSQQFSPDWTDAPYWANWLAQDESGAWSWFDTKPNWVGNRWNMFMLKSKIAGGSINRKETLQQRPKTTPQVEVGQVWKYKDYNYTVSSVGKVKISDEWLESVTYRTTSGIFYTRSLEDFLEKFKKEIGSE